MLKNYLKELGRIIKESDGVMTAKGKWIDYREAHKLQYGIVLGLVTFRLSKLQKRIYASEMDFLEWESNNKHYTDKAMLITYILKWIVLFHLGVDYVFTI